ncbi:hypothetical protein KY335_03180 [Candidatus Woesearchaeota archaeon]|nr:hypothetical protein [Candidatus Woesearchaeota archaeon]MBW3014220.1 hypothetical protein [Candidatus Woesearchaeota archaeon]
MDLEKIKKLPLEEQAKALKELKQEFEEERQKLKNEILKLEDSKKTKEGFAKSLADERRITTAAEINLIVSSIKDVKSSLAAKNKELEFLQKAVESAERLLEKSKKELEEEEEQEELQKIRNLITQLMISQQETDAKPQQKVKLEETVKKDKKADEDTLEEEIGDVQTRNQLEKNIRETEETSIRTADYSKEDTKAYMSERPSDEYEARNPVEEEEQQRQREGQYTKKEGEKSAAEEHFEQFVKYSKMKSQEEKGYDDD